MFIIQTLIEHANVGAQTVLGENPFQSLLNLHIIWV